MHCLEQNLQYGTAGGLDAIVKIPDNQRQRQRLAWSGGENVTHCILYELGDVCIIDCSRSKTSMSSHLQFYKTSDIRVSWEWNSVPINSQMQKGCRLQTHHLM
jgi:hypothetical protein